MNKIAQILSYPLSVIFYLLFGLLLLIFDVLQRILLPTLGYQAHKASVDLFNGISIILLRITLGTRFSIKDNKDVPKGVPILIVSNHQTMWDIPPIIWYLRRFHAKFVSKKELGKGVPTISFNLRHGGSVLIDRKDKDQAVTQLEGFAEYLNKTKHSGLIFAEGTRSKDNTMRAFKTGGLTTLIERMPGAYILPISISNSWELQKHGAFPLSLGVHYKMKVHQAVQITDQPTDQLIQEIENIVRNGISK